MKQDFCRTYQVIGFSVRLARALGFCVGRSYWSCHQQVACSPSLFVSHSLARSLLYSFLPNNFVFRCGKANDATAVGIYTTVTSLLPLSIQPARPSLSTFQVSLVICHNIVADDRTGDFLFLSHSLGVLIGQNNANIELPGLYFHSTQLSKIKTLLSLLPGLL